MKWIGRPVAEIWPFEIFSRWRRPPSWICSNRKWRRSIRRPRKPYPRTKHEVDRIAHRRDMAIRVCWGHMEPPFWGRGGRRGSAIPPLERAMVVSYRLSIVTVALSVTIQPEFAIECLRRSNQHGVGHFVPKFRGVPLGADPSCWGCKE